MLDAKRDPTQNNYCRIATTRYLTRIVGSLFGAYSQAWQQIGPEGRAAYAMGIFDVMIVFVAGDQYLIARALGLRQCGGEL